MPQSDRWEVELYERKRTPNMQSRPVRRGNRVIPEDALPVKLSPFSVSGYGVDAAIVAAKSRVRQMRRELASVSVAASKRHTLVVYIFKKESKT